jgi:hypothetical protein
LKINFGIALIAPALIDQYKITSSLLLLEKINLINGITLKWKLDKAQGQQRNLKKGWSLPN